MHKTDKINQFSYRPLSGLRQNSKIIRNSKHFAFWKF
jgi:hypothetical protein